ncbi:MAG: ferredoxin [Betaproteobacteria bacterium]|nr:ferredoxin [Betaproteobacteria bacterium]
MRIRIDQHRCIGAGQCVRTAPGIFDQREEDGIVILLNESPSQARRQEVQKAVMLCPSQSIKIEET